MHSKTVMGKRVNGPHLSINEKKLRNLGRKGSIN